MSNNILYKRVIKRPGEPDDLPNDNTVYIIQAQNGLQNFAWYDIINRIWINGITEISLDYDLQPIFWYSNELAHGVSFHIDAMKVHFEHYVDGKITFERLKEIAVFHIIQNKNEIEQLKADLALKDFTITALKTHSAELVECLIAWENAYKGCDLPDEMPDIEFVYAKSKTKELIQKHARG